MQYFNLSLLLTLNFTPFLSVSFEYMDVCRVLHSTLMNDDIIKTLKEKQQPKIARIKGLPIDDFHYYEAILLTLREKCPYSEFFWSVFSPNVGKYGPEKTPNTKTFHAVEI